MALPEGHQLAAKKAICWTDLRNETVLLSHYDPGRELEDILLAKLISTADRPKIERRDISPSSRIRARKSRFCDFSDS